MEISEGESTIRFNRGSSVAQTMQYMVPPMQMHPSQENVSSPQAIGVETRPVEQEPGTKIGSPMVGTFFDASSPDSDPYVKVGSVVKPGDVLCIIEAMKTFNQFEAEVGGTIQAVYRHNGDPVEFGEPLFLIS
jgi:acetyl-CoA carboxylase biotin carboxyl carrier protein